MKNVVAVVAIILGVSGCSKSQGTPPQFPFPMWLPSSVSVIGEVKHERSGRLEVTAKDSTEVVSGELWTGHVRVAGFAPRDRQYLATLERSLAEIGWESISSDERRDPPRATLHRSRGGEYLWITLDGWPDDVTVAMIHRR